MLMDAKTLGNLQREEEMKKDMEITSSGRRDFLKGVVIGTAAVGAATTFFSDVETGSFGVTKAVAASDNKKMAFIQWQPHTVPAAWSKGIEEVLKTTADRSTTNCSTARTRSRCRSA